MEKNKAVSIKPWHKPLVWPELLLKLFFQSAMASATRIHGPKRHRRIILIKFMEMVY